MKITKTTPVKKDAFDLKEGDVLESHGEEMVFLNFKMGGRSFVAQSVRQPDKKYRVRVSFDSKFTVIGKAEIEKIASELDALRKSPIGTLFVIKGKRSAELFRLKGFGTSGKIKAENPMDPGVTWTIDPSFTIKLLSNLK